MPRPEPSPAWGFPPKFPHPAPSSQPKLNILLQSLSETPSQGCRLGWWTTGNLYQNFSASSPGWFPRKALEEGNPLSPASSVPSCLPGSPQPAEQLRGGNPSTKPPAPSGQTSCNQPLPLPADSRSATGPAHLAPNMQEGTQEGQKHAETQHDLRKRNRQAIWTGSVPFLLLPRRQTCEQGLPTPLLTPRSQSIPCGTRSRIQTQIHNRCHSGTQPLSFSEIILVSLKSLKCLFLEASTPNAQIAH